MAFPRPHRRVWLVAAVVAVVAAVVAGLVASGVARPEPPGHTSEELRLEAADGVTLDATFFVPAAASPADPAPAVLLAHGFHGSKHSVAGDAVELAGAGYAVLTWTARGFGDSDGEIHLNHPDYEIRDAQVLLDWLAQRPDVRQDAPGDPRVAVVGASYGGALALLLAAYDDRVDAIVPSITWHDLARSFLPQATGGDPADGVFKQAWAGLFFGGLFDGAMAGPAGDPECGRFAADVCAAYRRVATSGRGDAGAVARLRKSSPAGVLDRITAPTLLIQGAADSLFPLAEADANAAGIAAAGTPVRVAWFTGGHDGGPGPQSDETRLWRLTRQWLDHYVAGTGGAPGTDFSWSRISGFSSRARGPTSAGFTAPAYPGLDGGRQVTVGLQGLPVTQISHPPGGAPAAISSVPAAEGLASFVNGVVTEVPGQHARYVSAPLDAPLDVVGAPTVRLRAASPTGEAVLFVKLYEVAPDGAVTLPNGLVAPVRLTGLPATITESDPVTVTLPAIARRVEAGHRLAVTVATTDQAYDTGREPAVYEVAVDGAVTVPVLTGEPLAAGGTDAWWWVLAVLLLAIISGVVVAVLWARRRRRAGHRTDPAHLDTPLAVRGLRKEYGSGFVAVGGVDLTVRRGHVVGLLGPNGAGKTTALRVVLGLTRPTGGEVLVFGRRLSPGAPVLSRVGALVEGPGFLPHLSGRDNLLAYWRATGRPLADARFDEVIEIAGLGDSIDRRVRTYSHGMRQRLAVAQAMLGLPELLVLDEPTDGLDPPQIAEMRRVLARYAGDRRAVLLSSHLLAEVEQTCSHVVVVHKGVVVAAGTVAEVVGESPTATIDVSDVAAAQQVVGALSGVRTVATEGEHGLVVDLDGRSRAEVVAALVRAGVDVDRVVSRRRLEDAFLALVGADTTGSGDR